MYELAVCYQTRCGVKADARQARHWTEQAAAGKHPEGLWALGVLRRDEGDHAGAVECFEGAAALGHPEALFAMGTAYGRGEYMARDEAKGCSLIAQAAEKGHIEAQILLGDYYAYSAPGFEQSDERAAHWYEEAASQDHPRALRSLGELTLRGAGGKKKQIERGWNYIERAAKAGDVEAMMRLAANIESGKDPSTKRMDRATVAYMALQWYQQAAETGHAEAQFTAGQRMLDTPQERERARGYLESAAGQGHAGAREVLDGLGEEPAVAVSSEASELVARAMCGDGASQYSLAMWHYSGYAVEQSFPLCYFWSKVLAKRSPKQAADLLQMAAASVSSGVRKKLDREAAAWTPGTAPPEM